ncbi:MAG: ABC transporter substrate-binding protein [Blautia sp.]|nr:ABC transporter substrate-binding protein [Blautia sp.]
MKKNTALLLAGILGVTLTSGVFAEEQNEGTVIESDVEATEEVTFGSGEEGYTPVTITVLLDRTGLGDNIKETFTSAPEHVVVNGDQMADYFFDLGLEDRMAGYTHGSCWSTVSEYPAREKVRLLGDGSNRSFSKEDLLDVNCDFLMGWDSMFGDDWYNKDFCIENGIAMYTPFCASDKAVFEDIYKDYETLGAIFGVEELAGEKVEAMKDTLSKVQDALGQEVYENPVNVFVYDSGEDGAFTACQGMPGDILKLAGGLSSFDDIEKGWATVSWEQIVERNPEAILILDYNGEAAEKEEFLKGMEALQTVDAIANDRIYVANCADMQGSAGSARLVQDIAMQLYPDKF